MKVRHRPVEHCIVTKCHVVDNIGPNRFRKHDWYGRTWVVTRLWARGVSNGADK